MRAVDTNVVVRFLTGDHPRQGSLAAALFRAEDVWLAKTVLLETEWVLRTLYRFAGDRLLSALRGLIALPNVQVEDSETVVKALEWAELGLDFADALHLAAGRNTREFVTFDEKFVKRAKRIGITGLSLLGG